MFFPPCLSAGKANTSINQYNSFALVNMAKIRRWGRQEKKMTAAARRRNSHLFQQVTSAPSYTATAPSCWPILPVFSTQEKGKYSPCWIPEDSLTRLPGSWESNPTRKSTSDRHRIQWMSTGWHTGPKGHRPEDTLASRDKPEDYGMKSLQPLFKPQKPHYNGQLWRGFIYFILVAEMLSAAPCNS